jgi:mRNA interferase MazF
MTRRHTVTYKSFEVVAVPFPFTDRKVEKRRPALILSDEIRFNRSSGHSVLDMITSQRNPDWPLDTKISESRSAGLRTRRLQKRSSSTWDYGR